MAEYRVKGPSRIGGSRQGDRVILTLVADEDDTCIQVRFDYVTAMVAANELMDVAAELAPSRQAFEAAAEENGIAVTLADRTWN